MTQWKLNYSAHGLEGTAGTSVAATFKHNGNASLKIDDAIITPEFDYALGVLGGNVEGGFIADTASTLTWEDTDFSAEDMIWLGNMAIKSVPGAASSFAFTFPSTSANTIKTFTFEAVTSTQEYEFAYGFCESFNIHGDVGADNGRIMYNAILRGRAATASTATSSLGFLANRQPLNINYSTIHFDSAGTAAGTASATSGFMRAFNLDVVTGWTVDASRFADGRSAKDFSALTFTDYQITGTIKAAFGSTAVTEIANARAGTPRIVSLKLNGTSSRLVEIKLPLIFTDTPEIGSGNDNGLHVVEFPFRAGYSRTSTAQAPEIAVTASASTTLS